MTDCIISFSKCVKLMVNRMGKTVLFIDSVVPPEADNGDAELIKSPAKLMFCLVPRRLPHPIAIKTAQHQPGWPAHQTSTTIPVLIRTEAADSAGTYPQAMERIRGCHSEAR